MTQAGNTCSLYSVRVTGSELYFWPALGQVSTLVLPPICSAFSCSIHPTPQSCCPCNCQVMFRLWLLLYCHYSCSGLMRLPIVATGLAAFQKRGPPSIHYTQAAFTKVCISRQSSSVFKLFFFRLNQSWRGHWRPPPSPIWSPPCSYQIFPSRLAPRRRPTFTTWCKLNNTDLYRLSWPYSVPFTKNHLSNT